MKVLAINSSPRGENSCTDMILKPLLAGMKDVGAETEIVHLNKLKMHQCSACLSCWTKTPGECIHKDDVGTVLQKFAAADFLIFGTPLYVYNVSGLMKNFLDRLIPLAMPFMEECKEDGGLTTHPGRYPGSRKTMLLVSPCGFPELENFSQLIAYMRYLAKPSKFNCNYAGEILRPTAEMMRVAGLAPMLEPYFANLKLAGKQLVLDGKIESELHEKLHAAWGTPEQFRERANKYFQDCLIASQPK